VEVLDGSRIHNEAYEWARKMAVDALEYDEEEGNPANALEEILQEPEKLAELDLDAFAEELERQGFLWILIRRQGTLTEGEGSV
jgi:transcription elongation factor SPT6